MLPPQDVFESLMLAPFSGAPEGAAGAAAAGAAAPAGGMRKKKARV